MTRSKFSENQVIGILKQVEEGRIVSLKWSNFSGQNPHAGIINQSEKE